MATGKRLGNACIAMACNGFWAAGLALIWINPAHAQDVNILGQWLTELGITSDVLLFALFTGAFSFSMMCATWLIRERRRLDAEHQQLTHENADLRARNERAQALLDVPDQRVVIWSGGEDLPDCRGSLPESTGAPADRGEFIAFGKWMTPQSAQVFEKAVARLRDRAESFDLTVETRSGTLLEVQGRASGAHAFVRFIDLGGERAALASLEAQHTSLVQTMDTMEALLEAIDAPVWLRAADDRLIWVNSAYIRAVDGSDMDKVCDDDVPLLDKADRETVARSHKSDEDTGPFKKRLPATIAGDRRIVDVCEVARQSGTAGVAIDMGEVEEVQGRLRRTIESHVQTLNLLTTAVAIFDDSQRLVFENDEFRSLWSLDGRGLPDEPTNTELFDFLRDEGLIANQVDWSSWRNSLMNVYVAREPQEHWWQLPDGRTLRVIANPHRQGGVTWVFENITEQLQMESRYIAMTQVQGETLDHMEEAIAVFASDGRLRLSNPAFQSLWQLDDEAVVADTPIARIAEKSGPLLEDDAVWQQLVTAVTGVTESRDTLAGRIELKDGTMHNYALVPLPDGQTMMSFADITANVRMEHALTERNEALLAAEELKNTFIEHVSYELRSPLTNIIGFAEMLADGHVGTLSDRQGEYVGHIATSSKILHGLVDNMLDLASVDAGIMELEFENIDLRETVTAAVRSVKDQLKEQNVRMRLVPPQKVEHFTADATRVHQILFNLLNNAIRFTPEGSEITVTASADRDNVLICVADSGPGIPEDQRERLFERFAVRAGGNRRAGLGLSIARSLADLHGGEISLDGDYQGGARFKCRLPRRPVAALSDQKSA